jgi:hypothetical protein
MIIIESVCAEVKIFTQQQTRVRKSVGQILCMGHFSCTTGAAADQGLEQSNAGIQISQFSRMMISDVEPFHICDIAGITSEHD